MLASYIRVHRFKSQFCFCLWVPANVYLGRPDEMAQCGKARLSSRLLDLAWPSACYSEHLVSESENERFLPLPLPLPPPFSLTPFLPPFKIKWRSQHCGIVGWASTCGASISYGCWFMSCLLQFRSAFLIMTWKSSRRWLKCLGPCYSCGRAGRCSTS